VQAILALMRVEGLYFFVGINV